MNDSKSLPRRDANAADFKTQSINNCNVTRYTRGGKNGKQLVCPECSNIIRIYHFNFSGLTCPQCKQSVDKYSWKVRTTEGKSASAIQDKLGSDSNTVEGQSYVDSLLTTGTN